MSRIIALHPQTCQPLVKSPTAPVQVQLPEVKPVEDQINYPFSKQTSGYNKSYDKFVKVNEVAKRRES